MFHKIEKVLFQNRESFISESRNYLLLIEKFSFQIQEMWELSSVFYFLKFYLQDADGCYGTFRIHYSKLTLAATLPEDDPDWDLALRGIEAATLNHHRKYMLLNPRIDGQAKVFMDIVRKRLIVWDFNHRLKELGILDSEGVKIDPMVRISLSSL